MMMMTMTKIRPSESASIDNNNNSEFIWRVFVKEKNPKRAAFASLVEKEEKGFQVALKK